MKWFVRFMLLITVILFISSIFYGEPNQMIVMGLNVVAFFIQSLIWSE